MDFGVFMFPTDLSIEVRQLGRAAEERGFESIWFPEHSHIPTSRLSPWPGGPELPEEYKRTLDLFGALTAVAAVTERIRVGTGICLVMQHDPIWLAKQVATLDFISNGRVLFGVGGGWNVEEMEDHGTDPSRRFRILAERVKAMKEIWTNDVAEFHGEFVDFGPMWQWPKPVQKPHPPVIIGGAGPRVFERVLDYCDGGWLPITGRGDFTNQHNELQRLAAEQGRGRVPISIFAGAANEESVERYANLGADRYLFQLPSAGADEVMKKLDFCTELAAKFT